MPKHLRLVARTVVEVFDLFIPLGEPQGRCLGDPVAVLHGQVVVRDLEDARLLLHHLDPVAVLGQGLRLTGEHLHHVLHRPPEPAVRQLDPGHFQSLSHTGSNLTRVLRGMG
jgi:hypothetical protein